MEKCSFAAGEGRGEQGNNYNLETSAVGTTIKRAEMTIKWSVLGIT